MNLKFKILVFALLSGLISCQDDQDTPDVSSPGNEMVLIGAKTAELLSTRGAYDTDEDGFVNNGVFYLTYPTTSSSAKSPKYSRLFVDFSNAIRSDADDTKGRYFAYTEGGSSGVELTNALIGSAPNILFLDNVTPLVNSAENDTLVIFKDDAFNAGIMTPEKDIVWGSETKHTNSNIYFFNLHHVMAGVRVKITVDQSVELADKYDLTKAEVYLSGMVLEPYSYSRLSGNVSLPKEPIYSNLILVNNLEQGSSSEDIYWGLITSENPDDEENKGNPVYITQDFILPPQSPIEDNWPELVVRFPNPTPEEVTEGKLYKEFYGKIPKGMFTDYPTGTNYGLDLKFLREHILEIRTRISQNPPQLVFMPVKVYDWVNWGPYTVIGHQEGVYNAQQLTQIVGYYNDYNVRMLERFGSIKKVGNQDTWVFDIFSNFTVPLDDIQGKIIENNQPYPILFRLHSYKVKVTNDNGIVLFTITDDQEFNDLIIKGIQP